MLLFEGGLQAVWTSFPNTRTQALHQAEWSNDATCEPVSRTVEPSNSSDINIWKIWILNHSWTIEKMIKRDIPRSLIFCCNSFHSFRLSIRFGNVAAGAFLPFSYKNQRGQTVNLGNKVISKEQDGDKVLFQTKVENPKFHQIKPHLEGEIKHINKHRYIYRLRSL